MRVYHAKMCESFRASLESLFDKFSQDLDSVQQHLRSIFGGLKVVHKMVSIFWAPKWGRRDDPPLWRTQCCPQLGARFLGTNSCPFLGKFWVCGWFCCGYAFAFIDMVFCFSAVLGVLCVSCFATTCVGCCFPVLSLSSALKQCLTHGKTVLRDLGKPMEICTVDVTFNVIRFMGQRCV